MVRRCYASIRVLASVWLFSLLQNGRCQRTFMHACDCEYITNGKCAYTLLLPVGDSVVDATCPEGGGQSGGNNTESMEDLRLKLGRLQANISDLYVWTASQARLLSQLQGIILGRWNRNDSVTDLESLDIAANVSNLAAMVQNLSSAVEDTRSGLVQATASLQGTGQRLGNIEGRLLTLETENARLANLSQSYQTALEELRSEGRSTRDYALCGRKGLLVSGPEESLPDDMISASTSYDTSHGPTQARINNTGSPGAWCPREPNSGAEWVQFDLGRVRTIVGIATKGRYDFPQWVMSYHVQYSVSETADDTSWEYIRDLFGNIQIFDGNMDQDTPRVNMFWQTVSARRVRIFALVNPSETTAGRRNSCLRADVIGCLGN